MNRRNFLTGLASCAATVTAFVSLPSFSKQGGYNGATYPKHSAFPTIKFTGVRIYSGGGYAGNSPTEDGQIVGQVLVPQSFAEVDGNIIRWVNPKING